jgi:hypothetical protein
MNRSDLIITLVWVILLLVLPIIIFIPGQKQSKPILVKEVDQTIICKYHYSKGNPPIFHLWCPIK